MAKSARRRPGGKPHATRGCVGLLRVLATALVICLTMPISGAASERGDDWSDDELVAKATSGKQEEPFADVKILIEHNATAEDTGFQVFLDGEPWNRLEIEGPGGELLQVKARGDLKTLGLTEFFFETNEPPNAEVPIEDLLTRFPEGDYNFEGRSIDGVKLTGTATLTHTIPKGPVVLSPADGDVVDPDNFVIEWMLVTESITGGPVDIVGYEVIITKPLDVPPPGFSKPAMSVHVSAVTDSLTVPPEFFEPDTEYEFEVLALEVGGNQTITAGVFSTQ